MPKQIDLPLCSACDNYADPRFWNRHPISRKPVPMCDGCWVAPNDPPDVVSKIRGAILVTERRRGSNPPDEGKTKC